MNIVNSIINMACNIYSLVFIRIRPHDLVLCYHNVGVSKDIKHGWISEKRSMPANLFNAQMKWLSNNADVVPLSQLFEDIDRRNKARIRVAITFDDGYFNNIEYAIPILKKLNLPMTWFVATGYVEDAKRLPWWDLLDYILENSKSVIELKEPEVAGSYDLNQTKDKQWFNNELRSIIKMSSPGRRDAINQDIRNSLPDIESLPGNAFSRIDEVAQAVGPLVELGGHTETHPNVTLCSPAELEHELNNNKEKLESITGEQINWFAYPFGNKHSFDEASAQIIRAAGFKGAVSLVPGVVTKKTNRYAVPRLPVSANCDLAMFKSRVLGAPVYALLDSLRTHLRK